MDTCLAWTALQSGWWGEGEVKFYLDGDTDQPTMADNGTEDYFGGSFGFSPFDSDGLQGAIKRPLNRSFFAGTSSVGLLSFPRRFARKEWQKTSMCLIST